MTWKLYTCEIAGKLAQVMIDRRFEKQAPITELPLISWFGVYCQEAPGSSFWNPHETQALDEVEDDLLEACETFGQGWVVYLWRIATPGIREYYLYHSDLADMKQAFEALKATHTTYRIEMATINDPQWSEYRKYVSFKAANKHCAAWRKIITTHYAWLVTFIRKRSE